MPKVIMAQAEIYDQMVSMFFSMHDFINLDESSRRELDFLHNNNHSETQAVRMCSFVAYAIERNNDRQSQHQELLAKPLSITALSSLYYNITPKEFFSKSSWCKELLKQYANYQNNELNSERKRLGPIE